MEIARLHLRTTSSPSLAGRGVIWAVALIASILLAFPACAQTFPPLSGRVVDQAGLLSAEQAAQLTAKLAALEKQSGRQMVIATIPSLQDHPIEDYGYKLGRAWGLGDKKANDGLILLIAPTERKIRIEVGYGLEPIVTDALASVIIQREIRPRFKEGDLAGGINAGADALIQLLQLPPEEAQRRADQLVNEYQETGDGGFPFSLIFWIVVAVFIFGSSISSRFGGGRHYRGGGSGPIVIWGGGDSWGGGGPGGGLGDIFSGGGGSFGGGGASGDW